MEPAAVGSNAGRLNRNRPCQLPPLMSDLPQLVALVAQVGDYRIFAGQLAAASLSLLVIIRHMLGRQQHHQLGSCYSDAVDCYSVTMLPLSAFLLDHSFGRSCCSFSGWTF